MNEDFAASPDKTTRTPIAIGAVAGLLLAGIILLFAPEAQDLAVRLIDIRTRHLGSSVVSLDELESENRKLERNVTRLRATVESAVPKSAYLVVSTSDNRFILTRRNRSVREGICSTGSYVLLKGAGDQEWKFETPRGSFRVLERRRNPVWTKPDWAFVEEGLPVPPPYSPLRYERGVLGDYALAIGNGYLIHGTLYQRMLGQPVTHGCIRLGDEDLEAVYRELALGAHVYIY